MVVVPVKPPAVGKSRLAGLTDDAPPRPGRGVRARHRRRPASHARRSPRSWSSPTTPASPRELAALGCAVMPDGVERRPQRQPRPGRRRGPAALAGPASRSRSAPTCRPCGRTTWTRRWPSPRPRARRRSSPTPPGVGHHAVRRAADRFDPRFGPDSRAAHLAQGAVEVAGDAGRRCGATSTTSTTWPRAAALGLGPHTARLDARPPNMPRAGRPGRVTRPHGASWCVRPSWPGLLREPSWPGLLGGSLLGRASSWPGAFLAAAVFLARCLLGPRAFFAGAFFAGRLLGRRPSWPGAFLAGAFFAGAFLAGAAFLAGRLLGRRGLLGRRLLRPPRQQPSGRAGAGRGAASASAASWRRRRRSSGPRRR